MDEESSGSLTHRRDVRRLLSLLLVLHFGAIAAYMLPSGEVDAGLLPDDAERIAGAVLPRIRHAVFPAARLWLDATGTRQHWTLFAPTPSSWTAELVVRAWYPVTADSADVPLDPDVPVALSGSGDRVTWKADTVDVIQAAAEPYPHLLRHRQYRLAFNMGYDGWGDTYRPLLARWLCLRETDARGVSPDGIDMEVVWRRMAVPWEPPPSEPSYRQALGGFTCHTLLGREGPDYLVDGAPDSGPGS